MISFQELLGRERAALGTWMKLPTVESARCGLQPHHSGRKWASVAWRCVGRVHSVAGEPLAQRAACAPTAGRRLNGF